jgi:pilus assembly protein CpaF
MVNQFNFAPLESLLNDPEVTEIMVNGADAIYFEKRGKLQEADVKFQSDEELIGLIQSLVKSQGREVNEMNPMVDLRLPDGLRFNAVLPPIAVHGPCVTIHKPIAKEWTWDELIGFGSLNAKMHELLKAIMASKLNVVVGGGTQSGKTTILNALSELIPADERIVTVENFLELKLRHPHVVRLETRHANAAGQGEVTMTDLIIQASMMRADRLMMAQAQGKEIWDILRAMSGGFDGTTFGIHATSVLDVLERIEMMATVATNLPLLQIRAKMAQSIQVIIQQMRLADGKRKIVTIAEVVGFKNNVIELQDIVRFESTGIKDGQVLGDFQFTGNVPGFASRLKLGDDFFQRD